MNIVLKEGYKYYDKRGNLMAEEKNGRLFLYSIPAFKDVMYDLTYSIYGDKCVYCGREANSIDHRIPQDFGGPTITDNMYPTCKNCNNDKTNMMENEYVKYRKLKKFERREFKESLKPIQLKRRCGEVQVLPEEWLTPEEECRGTLIVGIHVKDALGSKYKHLREFMKNYNRHQKPIIVSDNGFLLDGFNALILGKIKKKFDYDFITINNLEFVFRNLNSSDFIGSEKI